MTETIENLPLTPGTVVKLAVYCPVCELGAFEISGTVTGDNTVLVAKDHPINQHIKNAHSE